MLHIERRSDFSESLASNLFPRNNVTDKLISKFFFASKLFQLQIIFFFFFYLRLVSFKFHLQNICIWIHFFFINWSYCYFISGSYHHQSTYAAYTRKPVTFLTNLPLSYQPRTTSFCQSMIMKTVIYDPNSQTLQCWLVINTHITATEEGFGLLAGREKPAT